ncbi:4-sulfomuconolactone hydrolase [Halioglobus japonicus]|nr:4-sulfomuconolactone hydrolase [Halioglobus japonicus]
MSTLRIDSHQHFWQLLRGDYDWLTADLDALYRDYLPQELAGHLQRGGIDKTVLVQAATTVAESEYLLSLAEQHTFIAGVVGWIDMAAPDALAQLAQLARHPKMLGIRPMIQDIADTQWMLREELAPVYLDLISRGLRFDALVKPQHLDALIVLLQRYPELPVVIDHGAKPDIANDAFTLWAERMQTLAQESHACCKLSGLLTEARPGSDVNELRPYVNHLLQCFGPQRLMWGSDWPVLNLAADYPQWLAMTQALLADLDDADRDAIMGGTAARFYGLEVG